jgi:hypothetical protein
LAGQLENAAIDNIGTLSTEELLDRLTLLVDQGMKANRARTLAMMELFLEGTRSAEVRPLLAAALDTVLPVLRVLLEAAGLRPTNRDVASLYSTINGVMLTLLTHSTEALGLSPETTTDQFVRQALRAELAAVAG